MIIQCPSCNQEYDVEDRYEGTHHDCPVCGKAFTVVKKGTSHSKINEQAKSAYIFFKMLFAAVFILATIVFAGFGSLCIFNAPNLLTIIQGIGIIMVCMFLLLVAIAAKALNPKN